MKYALMSLFLFGACAGDINEPGSVPDTGVEDTDAGVESTAQALNSCGPYATTIERVAESLAFEISYRFVAGSGYQIIVDYRNLYTQLSPSHPKLPFFYPYYPTLNQAYVAFKNQLGCHIITSVEKGGATPQWPTLTRDLRNYFVQ